MKGQVFVLALISVLLSAAAQVSFKSGMNSASVQAALAQGLTARSIAATLFDIRVLGGFGLYGLSAVLWLWVLARTELSLAYPFVSVGFIITMFSGALFFGESLTLLRTLGTALVCLGVLLVAASA